MYLGNQPALAYTSLAKQDFTTSATTSYVLDNPVTNENEIALFINFVRQEPTTAYTASGTSLTLTSATSASDDMYAIFLGKAVQTVNPPAGSVDSSKINYPLTTFSSTGIDDNATSTAITIDSSGRLLIGTTDIGYPGFGDDLTIGSASGNNGMTIRSGTSNYGTFYFSDATGTSAGTYAGKIQYNHSDNSMVFATNSSTERMRITSDGRLQLATTSNMPYGGNQVRFSFEFNSSAAPYYGIEMKDNGSAGTTYGILFSRSSLIGSISYNASSVSYNTTSDYRLKNNISDVLNAIDRVKQLKPIRFNFISEPNKTVDGFLAHEVQEVVPEAIVGEKDAVETYIDDDGNEQTRPFYQGIDQSKLVPLLTAGLKEAIAKIETLEARITALENK